MERSVFTMEEVKFSLQPKSTVSFKKLNMTYLTLWTVVVVNFAGIISVLYAMLANVTTESLSKIASTGDTISALKTTFFSIIISVSIVCIIGIPVAYMLATHKGFFYNLIEVITFIPLILPPSVAGLALLMTFGKHGIIGEKLSQWGIQLPFTFFAIVIVQVFICMPFFIQIVKNGFDAVETEIIEAAKVFGAGDGILLYKFYIPVNIKAIFAGIILCCLRAAGEFGATIMFAGNMVGKTQTITTRIFSLYQYDVMQAVALAVIQLFVLLIPLLLLKLFFKH
ncbi:MAG: molybdate ABC transporter permease subunit [Firmicutes bacterium HGW-Firmicutes-7]|nr:MAG: molybdate ABC transporter permease subunit [Firmicutes bacterium HGW-Firmicutes-7]